MRFKGHPSGTNIRPGNGGDRHPECSAPTGDTEEGRLLLCNEHMTRDVPIRQMNVENPHSPTVLGRVRVEGSTLSSTLGAHHNNHPRVWVPGFRYRCAERGFLAAFPSTGTASTQTFPQAGVLLSQTPVLFQERFHQAPYIGW
jgi:hypothetical protein